MTKQKQTLNAEKENSIDYILPDIGVELTPLKSNETGTIPEKKQVERPSMNFSY